MPTRKPKAAKKPAAKRKAATKPRAKPPAKKRVTARKVATRPKPKTPAKKPTPKKKPPKPRKRKPKIKLIPGLDMVAAARWRPVFLAELKRTGNVVRACARSNTRRATAYKHRAYDPLFDEQWHDALDEAIDQLEGVGLERAMIESDVLLMFFLRAHRPKYRDKSEIAIDGIGGAPIQITSSVERDRSLAELIAKGLKSGSAPVD